MGAIYVDDDTWKKIVHSKLLEEPRKEPDFSGIRFHASPLFGIPIIRVPQVLVRNVERPPSILHDFDRWFARALSQAEVDRAIERRRREKLIDSIWRH